MLIKKTNIPDEDKTGYKLSDNVYEDDKQEDIFLYLEGNSDSFIDFDLSGYNNIIIKNENSTKTMKIKFGIKL